MLVEMLQGNSFKLRQRKWNLKLHQDLIMGTYSICKLTLREFPDMDNLVFLRFKYLMKSFGIYKTKFKIIQKN